MAIKRWNANTSTWELVGTPGTVTPAAIGAAALSGGNSFTGRQTVSGGASGIDIESTSLIRSKNGFRVTGNNGANEYQVGPFYNYTDFQITYSTDNFASHTPRLTIDTSGLVTVASTLSANSLRSNTGVIFYNISSNIEGNNGIVLGTAAKDVAPSGNQGAITIQSNNPSNQALMGGMTLITDATAGNRRLTLGVIEQGSAWRNVSINDNGGNLLVGGYTSSQGAYKLQVNSQIFATSSSVATSDGRYKENVNTINGGLDIIDSLRPVSFTWKDHPVHNFVAGKTVGFIAQEVQEALSEYDWVDNLIKLNVNEETNEEFLGIAESNIIPLLVAAVKELRSELNALKASML